MEKPEIRIYQEHPIYKGIYVSKDGWVWNRRDIGKKKGKPRKGSKDRYGYLQICFLDNGKAKFYKVHRLVAETFLPNTNNLPQINHLNEDKTDNRIENLEWASAKYNVNFGTRNERVSKSLIGHHNTPKKPVISIDKDGNETYYPSAMDAEKQLGVSQAHICKCCNGKLKTSGGKRWKYA